MPAPRIAKAEEIKPKLGETEAQVSDTEAKPRVAKIQKVSPKKPTAEK